MKRNNWIAGLTTLGVCWGTYGATVKVAPATYDAWFWFLLASAGAFLAGIGGKKLNSAMDGEK